MLIAALRDLQWRQRRFLIAVLGMALVFAMTLLMTGVSAGFDAEANRTMRDFAADGWLVREGASGPFLGAAPVASETAAAVAVVPGVTDVSPTVFTRKSYVLDGKPEEANVFGALAGKPGMPVASKGRSPEAPGEIMISTELPGFDVGDQMVLAGRPFTVVGELSKSTSVAGTANVFLTLADAQEVAFAGQPVANGFAIDGTIQDVPPAGLVAMSNDVAREDLLRALEQARKSITMIAVLLWVVAATIIGSMIYLSALERQRDFAVFKATGVSNAGVLTGLVLQAVLIALAASLIGSLLSRVLGPVFPMPVSIEASALLLLPVIATLVALLASAAGARKAVAVDPALAFGGP
jgi:putative ABC transport system permease protein